MHRSIRLQLLGRLGIPFALALLPALVLADPLGDPGYVVKSGDTLGEVAKTHNVSIEALCLANKLDRHDPIKIGQTLSIPAPEGAEQKSPSSAAATGRPGKPMRAGVVRLVRGNQTLQTRVLDRRRHLVENTLPELTRFLRYSDGATHPVDPRLVTLVGMVSDHFGGRDLVVVSGFRPYTPRQFTPHSNHNAGRALDFTIRGVTNERLRDFCRTLRSVGVGYYPNSSFVHLDVRKASATWTDFAGPGQPPRYHRPEEKDDADEGAGEVEGVASVDSPAGVKAGSGETPSGGSATSGKDTGNSSAHDSTGDHGVFPGRE
jgi:uncharacterized protein YcbK (DUF882 family)